MYVPMLTQTSELRATPAAIRAEIVIGPMLAHLLGLQHLLNHSSFGQKSIVFRFKDTTKMETSYYVCTIYFRNKLIEVSTHRLNTLRYLFSFLITYHSDHHISNGMSSKQAPTVLVRQLPVD